MLNQPDVARYLLEQGLLEPEAVLDGALVIRDASSRNRNFRVETTAGPAYLLKQGAGDDAAATVAHEARVYEYLAGRGSATLEHVPAYHGYDARNGVLILELIRNAEDLRTRHLRTGAFPSVLGARLGQALGTLHEETRAQYAELPPPWVLSLHRPAVSVFRDISAANIQLIKILQSTEGFGDRLDALRGEWRATSLIHQDVKWDNCLVASGDSDGIRLIDWEVATAGDPAWDVGSALSHYLSYWLFSIPVTGAEPPARFPSLAHFPLDAMKEPCRACWEAYADANPDDARGDGFLERSVAYAGGRLVQTAFEASQHAQQLASGAVLHLQLAFNILARPGVAATQLLELAL